MQLQNQNNIPDLSAYRTPTGGIDHQAGNNSLSALSSSTRILNGLYSNIPDLSQYKMSPTSASASSSSQPSLGGFGKAAESVSEGVAKGELSTANTLGTFFSKALGNLPGKVGEFFKGGAQEGSQIDKSEVLKPQGIGQKVGFTGEKIGEFFAPGSAEAQAYEKAASTIEQLPKALGLSGKAADTLVNTLKVATRGALSGTSMAGVSAAQGSDANQVKEAGEVGLFAGGIGEALNTFGKGLAEAAQKADFKLTPAAQAKASSKVESAAKFMTDNKILGSDSTKYSKLLDLNENLESTLISSLPKDVAIPKQNIIDRINQSIESLKKSDPAIYEAAKSDGQKAIKLLQEQENSDPFSKGGAIDAETALNSKRSYGSQAFKSSKASVIDPNVVSEGKYAIEKAYQNALDDTLSKTNKKIQIPSHLSKYFNGAKEVSLSDFNKVYSNAITSKDFTYFSQFKKDTGLMGRLFGLWAGETLGQVVSPGLGGKIIGGAAGEIGAGRIPGLIRQGVENAVANPEVIPNIAKVEQGTVNQP